MSSIMGSPIGPATTAKRGTMSAADKTKLDSGDVVDGAAQNFAGAKRGAVVALTSSGAAVAVDLSLANNFAHTLIEDTTLGAPSNPVAGQSGVIVFTQHASAPKTLGFNAFWKFAGGTVPTLTATNGAVDSFAYYVESATRATCSLIKDIK